MQGFREALNRLGGRLGGFSFNQKVLLSAVLAAALLSVIIFSVWLRSDEKVVLFTNLTAEDASAALDELAKLDVEADLANGGTTILVPAAQVHRLRVDLAARGIPSSGVVGFEIFDGKQYGLTEFLQNVNFKRALEGELTKTIASLAGIQSARVHLVLPKPSIFRKLQAEPTASVVVSLARNASLSESQITGIQSLVAGSVEGLAATAVTILDQRGKVLSAAFADDQLGRSESQLALKKEVEAYLTQKAQDMLASVLGEGASVVRVDATLNFEKIDREREIFDNQNQALRSEETQSSTDPSTGGESETVVTNYEVNRTVERVIGDTGGVTSLAVAVFVDGTYATPPAGAEGGGVPAYAPRSDEELDQIERIVQTAVGLDLVRGDRIEVVNMRFQGDAGLATPPAAGGFSLEGLPAALPEYAGRLLLFLVAAGMILTLKRNLGRMVGAGQGKAAAGRQTATVEQQEEEQMRQKRLKIKLTDEMASDVRDYAMENPEKMAVMLQTWIAQDE